MCLSSSRIRSANIKAFSLRVSAVLLGLYGLNWTCSLNMFQYNSPKHNISSTFSTTTSFNVERQAYTTLVESFHYALLMTCRLQTIHHRSHCIFNRGAHRAVGKVSVFRFDFWVSKKPEKRVVSRIRSVWWTSRRQSLRLSWICRAFETFVYFDFAYIQKSIGSFRV